MTNNNTRTSSAWLLFHLSSQILWFGFCSSDACALEVKLHNVNALSNVPTEDTVQSNGTRLSAVWKLYDTDVPLVGFSAPEEQVGQLWFTSWQWNSSWLFRTERVNNNDVTPPSDSCGWGGEGGGEWGSALSLVAMRRHSLLSRFIRAKEWCYGQW